MFDVNITYLCPHSATPCTAGKMSTLLPVSAGEIENYKKSAINKLCHKNERVLFSRYQYNANAPILSEIDGSGPREKAHIL